MQGPSGQPRGHVSLRGGVRPMPDRDASQSVPLPGGRAVSRRDFLRRVALTGLVLPAGLSILSACGPSAPPAAAPTAGGAAAPTAASGGGAAPTQAAQAAPTAVAGAPTGREATLVMAAAEVA